MQANVVAESIDDFVEHPGSHDLMMQGLHNEFGYSISAVVAAANGVEAFYGGCLEYLNPLIPATTTAQWKANRTRRPARIVESLRFGFVFGSKQNKITREIAWLYKRRDELVHWEEQWHGLEHHDILRTNVDKVLVSYRLETAERALAAMWLLIDTCIGSPRSGSSTRLCESGAGGSQRAGSSSPT